jgi:cytochrome c
VTESARHEECVSAKKKNKTEPVLCVKRMSVSKMVCSCLLVPLVWLLPACSGGDEQANNLTGGNAKRGVTSIGKYGCGSCHTIPGIRGARSLVGPDLSGVASRVFIAGVLSNSPDHMVDWIRNPQAIDDKTAMPNLSVNARDARDIAAYLYTLR